MLGLPGVHDRTVTYNPSPIAQFDNVFSEIWRTLVALVTGSLNPKWMSGPLGIVQVVHDNWMLGIKEAIYWLGAISLNLWRAEPVTHPRPGWWHGGSFPL